MLDQGAEMGKSILNEIRRSNMNLNEILHGSGGRGTHQSDMAFDSALADEDDNKEQIIENLEALASEGREEDNNVLDNKMCKSF